jgi:hypothetical protein
MSTVWVVLDMMNYDDMQEAHIVGVASSQERAREMMWEDIEANNEVLEKSDMYDLTEYVPYHFKDGLGSGLYTVEPFEVDE